MLKLLAFASLVACSSKPADLPQACFQALDCCSSLGRDLDDGDVKAACRDAKRFADEGSEEKCEIASQQIRTAFYRAYPSRSMGPTCEGKAP